MARLTFLGVGSGLCPRLGNTSAMIEVEDELLLLDCGYTVSPDLLQRGRLGEVTAVALTHVHADHVGGLELLGFHHHYRLGRRPRLIFAEPMEEELWEHTLRGGMGTNQDAEGNPFQAELATYFEPVRLQPGEAWQSGALPALTLAPTTHVQGKPCFGFFLGEETYYSGDSRLTPPELGPTGKPLLWIFQDCQLDEAPRTVHATLAQLSAMPAAQKAKTWLMHYGDGHEAVDARTLDFAGFVSVGQTFEI